METGSWFSVMNVVLVVVGVAIGAAAGRFTSPAIGEAKRLRDEVDRMQREHDTYRGSVDAHFRKTADLVGQMTKSYAAVYDHLAGGARTFCDDTGPGQKLPFEPLPGALASPVVDATDVDVPARETAAVGAAAEQAIVADWPTDVLIDDAAEEAVEAAAEQAAEDLADNADDITSDDSATTGYSNPAATDSRS